MCLCQLVLLEQIHVTQLVSWFKLKRLSISTINLHTILLLCNLQLSLNIAIQGDGDCQSTYLGHSRVEADGLCDGSVEVLQLQKRIV